MKQTPRYEIGPAKIGTLSVAVTNVYTGKVVRRFADGSAYANYSAAISWLKENKRGAQITITDEEPHFSQYAVDHPGWADKATSKRIDQSAAKIESIRQVRSMVKPGDTVSVILVSVARSGMSRRVRCLITHKGHTVDITRLTSVILGWHYDGDSVRVDGCGTDAAFLTVYELSRCLYPRGYKVPNGQGRANADSNGRDMSGGYALRNRWI